MIWMSMEMAGGDGIRTGGWKFGIQLLVILLFVNEVWGNNITETGKGEKDDVSDYATALLSDLGPLLALFGEKFAQQYMSYATSVLDSVLFALVPLGVITAIVGAIRVGGPSWLRSIIGRAREPRAVVELELMSSTSEEVCELWNGNGIVRVMGAPLIQQFVYIEGEDRLGNFFNDIYTIQEAVEKEILEKRQRTKASRRFRKFWKAFAMVLVKIPRVWTRLRFEKTFSDGSKHQKVDTAHVDVEGQTKRGNASTIGINRARKGVAPNISLNISARVSQKELRYATLVGIAVQATVIGIAGLISYDPQRIGIKSSQKKGNRFAVDSFILFAVGSVALCFGMFICAVIVDESTKETRWQKSETKCQSKNVKMTLIWIQRGHIINDQVFDSAALFTKKPVKVIRESTRKEHDVATLTLMHWSTVFGTFMSIAGFAVQFIGLRGLHWSVPVMQLVAIVGMGAVRAWIRRGISENPLVVNLPKNFELEWLASVLAPCHGVDDNSLAHKIKEEEKEKKDGSSHVDSHLHPENLTRFESLSFSILRFPHLGPAVKENLADAFPSPVDSERSNSTAISPADLTGTKSLEPQSAEQVALIQDLESPKETRPSASKQIATISEVPRIVPLKTSIEPSQVEDPKADSPQVPRKPSLAQRAIDIRERLGEETRWMGPASDAALALSCATDSVMDSLGTLFSSDSEDQFEWDLPYCCSVGTGSRENIQADTYGKDSTPFHLPVSTERLGSQTTQRRWCLDANRIEAILSMWLYDCHYGPQSKQRKEEIVPESFLSSPRKLAPTPQSSIVPDTVATKEEEKPKQGQGWLRRKRQQKSIFFLGEDTSRLRRDLRWWVPRSGTRNLLSISARKLGVGRENEAEPFHYDIPYANIVGYDVPIFFQKSPMDLSPKYGWQLDCWTVSYDDYSGSFDSTGSEAKNIENERQRSLSNIGIMTSSAIELLLAQHLFGILFDKIVENVVNIRGESSASQDQQSTTDFQWQNFYLGNTTVSQLAVAVQNAGLSSTSEEAFQLVIPTLSRFNRLPVEAVAQFIVDKQNTLELDGDWHRCARLYGDLFDIITSHPTSCNGTVCRFKLKAMHAIIDHVCRFEAISESMVVSGNQALLSDIVKNWESRLEKNAAELQDVVTTLKFIYKQQGRREQEMFCASFIHGLEQAGLSVPGIPLEADRVYTDFGCQSIYDLVVNHFPVYVENSPLPVPPDENSKISPDITGYSVFHGLLNLDKAGRDKLFKVLKKRLCDQDHARVLYELISWLKKQSQANIDWKDTSGCTALHYAARKPTDDKLLKLLSIILNTLNPDLTIRANDGATALHYAAEYNPEFAMMLIEHAKNAKVDCCDVNGRTPLHRAASGQSNNVISLLLDRGANPDARDQYGTTPLHILAFSKPVMNKSFGVRNPGHSQGLQKSLELLFSRKDLNLAVTDRRGRTALHLAALSDNVIALTGLLSKPTIPVDAQDEEGNTILHLAAMKRSTLSKAVINILFGNGTGGVEKVGTLKEVKNKAGKTPFLLAVSQGLDGNCYYLIKMAKEFGLETNAVDLDGNNAMHQAVKAVRPSIQHLRSLMKAGVAHHTPNKDGMTPLHLCFDGDRPHLAPIILEYHTWLPGQIDAVDKKNRTALNIAIERIDDRDGSTEIEVLVKSFLSRGADLNASSNMASHNRYDTGLADRNERALIPLHHAVVLGKPRFTRALIDCGSKIRLKDPSNGRTPLHLAGFYGHYEIIELLISKVQHIVTSQQVRQRFSIPDNSSASTTKVDINEGEHRHTLGSFELFPSVKEYINERDEENGSTALALACGAGGCQDLEVASLLIDHGADPNIFDKRGHNILHATILSKNTQFILSLFDKGLIKEAGHCTQDADSCTALHLAAREGDCQLIRALRGKLTDSEVNARDSRGRIAVMDVIIYGTKRHDKTDAPRTTLRALQLFTTKVNSWCNPHSFSTDFTLRDNDGMTTLQHALDLCQWFVTGYYITGILMRIIEKYPGAMLIAGGRTGQTPLSILLGRFGCSEHSAQVEKILNVTLMSQPFYHNVENLSRLSLDPCTLKILIFDGKFPGLYQFVNEHQLISPEFLERCLRSQDQYGWSPWTCIREKYSPIARIDSTQLGNIMSIFYPQSQQILESEATSHWSSPEFLSNPLLRASRQEETDEDEIQREWSERLACESSDLLRFFDPSCFQKDGSYVPKYNWLIANRPFPPCFTTTGESSVSRYFEVTIFNTRPQFQLAEEDRSSFSNVIIGLTSMSLWGELCSREDGPDYPPRSWVYKGHSGAFETDTTSERRTWLGANGWNAIIHNDIVGCGITDTHDVFFTLNGEYLGVAEHGVTGQLFPLVCVGEYCKVKANFGKEPFSWNFERNLPKLLAELMLQGTTDGETSYGSEDEDEGVVTVEHVEDVQGI